MELSQVKRIRETAFASTAEEYITKGWALLAILPSNRSDAYACYILGHTEPEPPKQPPRQFFDEDCDCESGWILYEDEQGYMISKRCPACMAKYDQKVAY